MSFLTTHNMQVTWIMGSSQQERVADHFFLHSFYKASFVARLIVAVSLIIALNCAFNCIFEILNVEANYNNWLKKDFFLMFPFAMNLCSSCSLSLPQKNDIIITKTNVLTLMFSTLSQRKDVAKSCLLLLPCQITLQGLRY